MQLLIIVLNQVECLEELLGKLSERGLPGATILDSKGMAHSLSQFNETKFMVSLRQLLDPERQESKTIFMVLPEEQIPLVSTIVNDVVGGMDQPDTGVMFSVPVNYLEGFGQ